MLDAHPNKLDTHACMFSRKTCANASYGFDVSAKNFQRVYAAKKQEQVAVPGHSTPSGASAL